MDGFTAKPAWRAVYDEAFDRFGVIALWNCAPNPGATPDEARAIAQTLRRQGNMSAWRLADRLIKACDAAQRFSGPRPTADWGEPITAKSSLGKLESANIGPTVQMTGLSLLMAGVGAVMGRVGPNPFVGVRTPWAYQSRVAWQRTNRLLGRLWFIGGLAGIAVAAFVIQPAGLQMALGWMVATDLLAAFESWRVWRNDPDRKPF